MIVKGKPRAPVPKERGPAAAALVAALLQPEPADRLSAEAALKDEWLASADAEKNDGGLRAAKTLGALESIDTSVEEEEDGGPPSVRRAHSNVASERRGLTQTTAFFKSLLAVERPEADADEPSAGGGAATAPVEASALAPALAPPRALAPAPAPAPAPSSAAELEDAEGSASSSRKPGTSLTKAELDAIKAEQEAKAQAMKDYALQRLGLAPGGAAPANGQMPAASPPPPPLGSGDVTDLDHASTSYSIVG